MKAHITYADDDLTRAIAYVHPASKKSVKLVLAAPTATTPTNQHDGRSDWVWLRLPNGDLFLGVFPQGDTYFSVEADAAFPWKDYMS